MNDADLIEEIARALHGDNWACEWSRSEARVALAVVRKHEGWQPIETAPKDGTIIHVWANGYEYPEAVLFERYGPEVAEEAGGPGYWRFAEELLSDVTDSAGEDLWTHWRPIPQPPSTKGD